MHPEFLSQPTDEVLETVWRRQEAGVTSLAGLLALPEHRGDVELVDEMAAAGLVHRNGDRITLTPAGEARARSVVRCHRLAERLLHDVLGLPASQAEDTACLMEHVLSPTVADAVCTFLGHPPTSPGGHDIPAGDCCAAREGAVQALVLPLEQLEPGQPARIVFMSPRDRGIVDRLGSYGVAPGSAVRLRQRRPSVVLDIEGTTLALDPAVARAIYVRRES